MSHARFKGFGQGRSLPPGLLIRLGRLGWTTIWKAMMSQLAPRDQNGAYIRPVSQFRERLGDRYLPASGRYELIVGMGCPWAHRTLVVRVLKGLEDAIAVTLVVPSPDTGGWIFQAPMNGCNSLRELYQFAQPGYQGRATVPVLWDKETNTIVNNESAEIIEILNSELNEFAKNPGSNLYPDRLKTAVDQWNEKIYNTVNNGVYRCGFAQTQVAYQEAFNQLFTTLDEIDAVLANQRYLCGNELTLADVRLFTTLIRFDVVYYGLFKCNRRRIQDYPHLKGYLQELYQLPGIAATCDLETIKQDYYGGLFPLNPGGIVPEGPDLSYLQAKLERNYWSIHT